MPARRKRSGNPDRESDVSPAQLRELMKQYKIHFRKYNKPWPDEHMEMFKDIKQIGREEYETYRPNENRDGLTVAQTRERVHELVKATIKDYDARTNEQTLRLHTEPLVFKRFESEFTCRKCGRPLWISEYAERMDMQVAPERPRPGRTDMMLCRCPLTERYEGRFSHPEPSLFSDRCSTELEHDPADEIPEYPIPRRMPDRVFGLNVVGSIGQYTQCRRDLRHTPFPTSNDLVYPFLISEAKPGVQNPGSESIDTQTAFPIRSCLLLQKHLREAGNVELNPLVWYMPYQGDVWRLAACVIQQDEVQVYNLWMGSSADPDRALQLLLIIDYIVQWARNTFRKTILACLARGWDAVQRETPAPATGPLQRTGSLPLASLEPGERFSHDDIAMDDCDINNESDETERESTPSSEGTQSPNLAQQADRPSERVGWETSATIRQAYLIKFEFVHIKLPENWQSLLDLLQSTIVGTPTEGVRTKAQNLFQIFSSTDLTIPLHPRHISHLKNEWLRTETNEISQLSDESLPLRTWIHLDTEFDRETWHIVRRMSCVSCSASTAELLIHFTGELQRNWPTSNFDSASRFEQVKDALTSIRCLPSEFSAQAALRNLSLHLQPNLDSASCRWELAATDTALILEPLFRFVREQRNNSSNELFEKNTILVEVLSRPVRQDTLRLLGSNYCRLEDAVLLRKPDYWPNDTEQWCLFTLKEQDPGDWFAIGDKLAVAVQRRQVYTLQNGHNVPGMAMYVLDEVSEQFLRGWKQAIVNGEALPPECTARWGGVRSQSLPRISLAY